MFYFDTIPSFGLRSATLACQRTTNAISYIFRSAYHHECINYIDDFGGAEASYNEASLASQDLEDLLTSLGLESFQAKDCPPSTRMAFLGLIYDTVTMTLEVPPDKLRRTSELIRHWLHSPRVKKSDLQSLIGKLSHMCASISPGRIFMKRLLHQLRHLPDKPCHFSPSPELLADLRWWQHFLTASPCCVHSLGFTNSLVFALTQTLLVLAAFFDGRFVRSTFPPFIDVASLAIASLEMLAVTVSLKLWS